MWGIVEQVIDDKIYVVFKDRSRKVFINTLDIKIVENNQVRVENNSIVEVQEYNKELYELPKRMQRILRERARGLLGDVRTNVLAGFLNQDDFIVSGVDERGMVTAGGVSLDEIDMQTMKAKRFEGLYVIGEALNADGITGGYNLQLCWSTACTAADDLKKDI
jgi:predicted flavoprotein YhiN